MNIWWVSTQPKQVSYELVVSSQLLTLMHLLYPSPSRRVLCHIWSPFIGPDMLNSGVLRSAEIEAGSPVSNQEANFFFVQIAWAAHSSKQRRSPGGFSRTDGLHAELCLAAKNNNAKGWGGLEFFITWSLGAALIKVEWLNVSNGAAAFVLLFLTIKVSSLRAHLYLDCVCVCALAWHNFGLFRTGKNYSNLVPLSGRDMRVENLSYRKTFLLVQAKPARYSKWSFSPAEAAGRSQQVVTGRVPAASNAAAPASLYAHYQVFQGLGKVHVKNWFQIAFIWF